MRTCMALLQYYIYYYAPPLIGGGIKRWCCLTSVCLTSDVCLSRTSGLSREQRGLRRLKLAYRYPTSHVTRTPLSRSESQRSTCLMGKRHSLRPYSAVLCFALTVGTNLVKLHNAYFFRVVVVCVFSEFSGKL